MTSMTKAQRRRLLGPVDPLEDMSVAERYGNRFGPAGSFNAMLLPPPVNQHLMQAALKRGTPVSRRSIALAYRRLYGKSLPPDPPLEADI